MSGAILVLFDLTPASGTGALVVSGLGIASLLLAQGLHVFDPLSGTLDPGSARVLTVVNAALGTILTGSSGIIGLLPEQHGGPAHVVLAVLGAAQLAVAAALHSADAQVNAPPTPPPAGP